MAARRRPGAVAPGAPLAVPPTRVTAGITALITALAVVVAGVVTTSAPLPARAAPVLPDVTVRVTLLELRDLGDDLDSTSDADFYTVTSFDDGAGGTAEHTSGTWDGEEVVHPNTEWTFAANPAKGSVAVGIGVFDDDDTFNGGDDRADVVSGGDSAVAIDVKLRPCAISGNVGGACGQQITTDDGDRLVFKVDVLLPTSTPGLRMQCLHDPIWPQPGQLVTITATALDGAANPLAVADRVTIKVEGTDVETVTGAATATFGLTATGTQLWYECEAEDAGGEEAATTTPRMVRIGATNDRAVPIVFTGPSDRRIDVVLLADRDAYTGPTDPDFLGDIPPALLGGYYGDEFALTKQSGFNLWIARSTGADGDWPMGVTDCTLVAPEDWDRYGFAEVGWILHDDVHRDCARSALRLFSALDSDPRISLHETGHVPFGLADEYCCDGGYFTNDQPNLYSSSADCQADAPAVGVAPGACRWIGTTVDGNDWFTSDPVADNMMDGNGAFQPLDRRRWTNLLTSCTTQGGC
jgi:hypothetical protein